MKPTAYRVVVAALGIVLVAQISFVLLRPYLEQPRAPRKGMVVPDIPTRSLTASVTTSLQSVAAASSGCLLLVAVSPECPACRSARATWTRRFRAWQDSLHTSVVAAWLFFDDSLSTRAFIAGYDFSNVQILVVLGALPQAARKMHLLATPTYYVIDRAATVRFWDFGDVFPPADSVLAACGPARSD